MNRNISPMAMGFNYFASLMLVKYLIFPSNELLRDYNEDSCWRNFLSLFPSLPRISLAPSLSFSLSSPRQPHDLQCSAANQATCAAPLWRGATETWTPTVPRPDHRRRAGGKAHGPTDPRASLCWIVGISPPTNWARAPLHGHAQIAGQLALFWWPRTVKFEPWSQIWVNRWLFDK